MRHILSDIIKNYGYLSTRLVKKKNNFKGSLMMVLILTCNVHKDDVYC